MFDLSGRHALVTGAGQGIGAGIARHLASQGARVAVNDIVKERAEEQVEALRAEGGKADALAFDVTNLEQVCELLTPRNFDIVVNNAGNAGARMMEPRQFREMDPSQWGPPIDVNLTGVMNTTHAVLPGMCERGFGRLVTISSGAGLVGLGIGVAPYGAGKGGAISFMRHMAIENASFGVTSNSVALGMMEMTDVTDAVLVAKLASTVPMGRLGTGDDLGPAIVWLVSNEACWVTGQTIQVNGGSVTS